MNTIKPIKQNQTKTKQQKTNKTSFCHKNTTQKQTTIHGAGIPGPDLGHAQRSHHVRYNHQVDVN
jgi:hypothetical protein